MSVFTISQVLVLENPSKFESDIIFDITFESMSELKEDVQFKITYVGSADHEKYDQVLQDIYLGPIQFGVSRFQLIAPHPDPKSVPAKDLLGVTVILLTALYKGKEFCRIGYYVNNEYTTEELKENPPEEPLLDAIERNILADKPRVTFFQIEWDSPIAETEMEITNENINEGEDIVDFEALDGDRDSDKEEVEENENENENDNESENEEIEGDDALEF